MTVQAHERDYIRWQNRAFRFYLGARLSYLNELYPVAAFCAQQALEALLKATLLYWDRSFDPEAAGHSSAKLLRILRNKAKEATGDEVPLYLLGKRYQTTTRYPSDIGGVSIPSSFLADLDSAFADLVLLVPFQFNSELKHLLAESDSRHRRILTRHNQRYRGLIRALGVRRNSHRDA